MLTLIDGLLAELNALRPLPRHTVKSLHEQLVLEWTYNSNAIEGNSLTLKETKVVLEGMTVDGKTIREHFEAINHKAAIHYVEAAVGNYEPLSEALIAALHKLLLNDIEPVNAGVYRTENILISGAEHIPPEHFLVPERMKELVSAHNHYVGHAVERAARLHVDFVKIHPFVDSNGPTARLLMNFDLMKASLLPVVIKATDRLAYYEALDKAYVKNEYEDFVGLVAKAEVEALETMLVLVGGK